MSSFAGAAGSRLREGSGDRSARLPYADDTASDPRQPLIDAAGALMQGIVDAGCAAQLEAIALRLLPDLARRAELPPPAPPAAAAAPTHDARLARAAELTGLRSIRARRLTEQERAALDAAIARTRAEITHSTTGGHDV